MGLLYTHEYKDDFIDGSLMEHTHIKEVRCGFKRVLVYTHNFSELFFWQDLFKPLLHCWLLTGKGCDVIIVGIFLIIEDF